MNKAAEYRNNARECRALAQAIERLEQARREQLLKVAAAWEEMAVEQDRRFSRGFVPSAFQRVAAWVFLSRAVRG